MDEGRRYLARKHPTSKRNESTSAVTLSTLEQPNMRANKASYRRACGGTHGGAMQCWSWAVRPMSMAYISARILINVLIVDEEDKRRGV